MPAAFIGQLMAQLEQHLFALGLVVTAAPLPTGPTARSRYRLRPLEADAQLIDDPGKVAKIAGQLAG
jgi:hypothetical protein